MSPRNECEPSSHTTLDHKTMTQTLDSLGNPSETYLAQGSPLRPKYAWQRAYSCDNGSPNLRSQKDPLSKKCNCSSPPTVTRAVLKPPATMATSLALEALKSLPTPLLVLSEQHVVVLMNNAMEELLGKAVDEEDAQPPRKLMGRTLNDIGIDLIQAGTRVWVQWDKFLQRVESELWGSDSSARQPACSSETYEVTLSSVFESSDEANPNDTGFCPSKLNTSAEMTISPWIFEGKRYMNLTFKPVLVARSRATSVSSTKSIPVDGYKLGKDKRNVRFTEEEVDEIAQSWGLQKKTPAQSPDLLRKIGTLKEALLDAMDIPVFAVWHDQSIAIPNRAGIELASSLKVPDDLADESSWANGGRDILSAFEMYTEDFTRILEKHELPMVQLCKNRKSFKGKRIGIITAKGAQVVYEIDGTCIFDNGEFIAGLGWFRDVTPFKKELESEGKKQEIHFRTICDSMPQLIWAANAKGEVDYFSNRWEEYTGRSLDSLHKWAWLETFHPDDRPNLMARYMQAIAEGGDYSAEYRCLRHDGQYRWMLGRALPFRDPESGKITRWYGTTTDIHDLVETRTKYRDARDRLAEVLRHTRVTLWAVNKDRKLTLLEGKSYYSAGTSRPAVDVGGGTGLMWDSKSPEQQYGRDIGEILNGASKFCDPIKPILDGTSKDSYSECEVNGHFYRTKYVPFYGKKGVDGHADTDVVDGVIGLSMDATKQHVTERNLEERDKQNQILVANEAAAREASKLKSEFLASMSHEIRTPIAGVVGMAEILLDTPLTDEQVDYAENITRSANALLTVINDILDLSKVESGRMDIEEVQFNLSHVIRDVIKILWLDAMQRNLEFITEINFPGDKEMTLMGDPGRIRQILMNLLSNSLKFTSEGFVELNVSVLKDEEEDDTVTVKFLVRDSGIGIDEEVRHKLFQPFTQADSSTARRFGGTGLGLTISKNLVDLMGGEIGLESAPGAGTEAHFTVTFRRPQNITGIFSDSDVNNLPERLQSEMSVSCRSSEADLSTPPDSTDEDGLPGAPARRHRSSSKAIRRHRFTHSLYNLASNGENMMPPEERKKRHILVVEDNDVNQQIAIKLIQKLHFTVSAVSNGVEALAFLDKTLAYPASTDESLATPASLRRPDLILMDVQMPEMDGYSATRAIRAGKLFKPLDGPAERPQSPRKDIATTKAKEWLASIPIVAMTASAIQGDKEKCRDAGMDDYLAKPVRGETLQRMLLKWVARGEGSAVGDRPGISPNPSASSASAIGGKSISSAISKMPTPPMDPAPVLPVKKEARSHRAPHSPSPKARPTQTVVLDGADIAGLTAKEKLKEVTGATVREKALGSAKASATQVQILAGIGPTASAAARGVPELLAKTKNGLERNMDSKRVPDNAKKTGSSASVNSKSGDR